jgi:hypothetical protein
MKPSRMKRQIAPPRDLGRDMHESCCGPANASGLSRGKFAHRDIRTGTGASFSNVRVTPPTNISTGRAWL